MLIKIRKMIRFLKKDSRGAVAVEFAMIAPAMIAMLYGLMEGGRYYWIQHALDYAVEEGARYASTDSTLSDSEIIDYTKDKMININLDKVVVTVTTTANDATSKDFKAVEAYIPFNIYVAFDAAMTEININAKAEMLVLQ